MVVRRTTYKQIRKCRVYLSLSLYHSPAPMPSVCDTTTSAQQATKVRIKSLLPKLSGQESSGVSKYYWTRNV